MAIDPQDARVVRTQLKELGEKTAELRRLL